MKKLWLVAVMIFLLSVGWGWRPLIVLSGSMEPVIPTGSVMFYDSKDKEISEGDIITYILREDAESEPVLVTHRVVRMEKDGYITKGDHNEQEDFVSIKPKQVLGTYRFHIPKAGYLISKLNRRLLIAAAFWLFLFSVLNIAINSIFEEE